MTLTRFLVTALFLLMYDMACIAGTRDIPDNKIPTEVKPFILKGMSAIELESADLNGDGRQDYILVLEDTENDLRPLLILVRNKDNTLTQAKRNDKVVFGPDDGGIYGDPFQGINADSKSFSVSHYGGSAWRWSFDYTFKYSRIDNTWQLVRVEETEIHINDPSTMKERVYIPPRDYGKIDIADFDPQHYRKPRKRNKHQ